MCGHWSLKLLFLSLCLTSVLTDFFEWQDLNKNTSLSLFRLLLFSGSPSTLMQTSTEPTDQPVVKVCGVWPSFLNSSIYKGALESPNFPKKHSPWLFLLGFWQSIICCSQNLIFCFRHLHFFFFFCESCNVYRVLSATFLAWVHSALSKADCVLHQSFE